MNLGREGFSTGTCAAAAAKAAVLVLAGRPAPPTVDVSLPDGTRVSLTVVRTGPSPADASAIEAGVRKEAGDDPDVTHGSVVLAAVRWEPGDEVSFAAGEGVGTVTLPGLAVPVGEPAINPVPRAMIRQAVREVTPRGVRVTVSIPGGRELAEKTFNPRLGISGGLSILGTTGRVRPFSHEALRTSLKCSLNVALASGCTDLVFVPGHIGERAARRHFPALRREQVVEVSNEWGFILDEAASTPMRNVLAVGHPGKLAKLTVGEWDTHSSRSQSAVGVVADVARRVDPVPMSQPLPVTVDAFFAALDPDLQRRVGDALAAEIAGAIGGRLGGTRRVAAVLVNLRGDWLGSDGDVSGWR